jgi:caffeoyl-CoA O-methyltransferase
MNITEPKISDYLKKISSSEQLSEKDAVLKEMEEYALRHHFPIIGPLVGRFLRQLAFITGAENIFEMGSGFGYSAIWLAGGIPKNGKIICTDFSADNKKLALEYFRRAGCESKIDFHVGDAGGILGKYHDSFDIILNDIDKEQYPESFDLALNHLKKGGVFITDNVLWSGRILDDSPGKAAQAVIDFNKRLFNSKELLSSIIPLRDGLGLAVKI